MKRAAIVVLVMAALVALGSNAASQAQDSLEFSASWCDAPVVVPIATADASGTRLMGNVVTARGAEPALSSLGPVVRMEDQGSRVQVVLGQTLFHTQWVLAGVGPDDIVRVDATIGRARQPLDASSVRGALVADREAGSRGLVAIAANETQSIGQIDLFTPATEVLFTNEGGGAVDLVAAVGCPAIDFEATTLSAPSWDADSQRFVAEHEVTIRNGLANAKTRALRSQFTSASSTIIDDLTIDIAVSASGFANAEVIELDMNERLRERWRETFDGVSDTGLLTVPLRLVDDEAQRIAFTVAYTPDFDDPDWAEGVASPAPVIEVRALVDEVNVGLSASLHHDGAEVDTSAAPNRLITPSPGVVVEHEFLREPTSQADGRVSLSERITVTNVGETAVEDLRVEYPQAAMYGARSEMLEFAGLTTRGCAGSLLPTFDGDRFAGLIALDTTLAVDDICTIDLRSTVLPGEIPESDGTDYEQAVVATARSGARDVRDARAIQSTLAQTSQVTLDSSEHIITNLRDGRYRIEGSATLRNTGDQNLESVTADLVFSVGADDTPEPARVLIESVVGVEGCDARSAPSRRVSSLGLTRGATLAVGQSCTLSYSAISQPGAQLDGWQIESFATAVSPRDRLVEAKPVLEIFGLPEAPAATAEIEVVEVRNIGDGTYVVTTDTTISNTGDTPLISVDTPNGALDAFGERLRSSETLNDTCSNVTRRRPMPSTSPASTCHVTTISVVEPEAQLDGWVVDGAAGASSTSGRQVEANAESAEFAFVEQPAMTSSISQTTIERVDDRRFRFDIEGTISNTGDIELRDVQLLLDLEATFGNINTTINTFRSTSLEVADDFDGSAQVRLFETVNVLRVGDSAEWRVVFTAETRTASGPFLFEAISSARSPASALLAPGPATVERALPLVQIIDRSLNPRNNGDGTYLIQHELIARNVGGTELPAIEVTTDFARIFDDFLVEEPSVTTTCDETVTAGSTCAFTESAVLRPGSAVGPYVVTAEVASIDGREVQAIVVGEPTSVYFESRANTPLWFEEAPAIALHAEAGPATNNGDGTYAIDYRFEVTNDGDVPLYRVGGVDPIDVAFAGVLVANDLRADTCSGVSFSQPLAPGEACLRSQTAIVRPGARLGPWVVDIEVSGDTPTFATVVDAVELSPMTLTETVSIDTRSTLTAIDNTGDGTYVTGHDVQVTNTGDVPLHEIVVSDAGPTLGDSLLGQTTVLDECSGVSPRDALAPGATCRLVVEQRIRPGRNLGPMELRSEISVASPSGAARRGETTTPPLTLTEAPAISLMSDVKSVENTDEDTLRVILDLEVVNDGDVRIDEAQLDFDIAALFPDGQFRIAGLISNDLDVADGFTAGETTAMLAPGQSLTVGRRAVVTLILSVTADGSVGPFVGELRATGTSPAQQMVTAVIAPQVDLPSIGLALVAQSVDNNRDGSYTVNTTYSIDNNGSTPLEFVRLIEDVESIYGDLSAELLVVTSDDVATVDLTDRTRESDVLEWAVQLSQGEQATVTTTVLVVPGNVLGPFVPTARTLAVSPTGTSVVAELDAPTPIEFVENPALRVEQTLLGRPVWNPTGTFDVSFAIDVINDGDVELRNVQVNQDLLRALGPDANIVVHEIRSSALAVNEDFDGQGQAPPRERDSTDRGDAGAAQSEPIEDVGDTRLLLGGDTLPAGSRSTIELDMTITPESRGVYSTRAIVSARTPAGAGLGSVGEEIEANTLTRLSVQGELGVAKQVIGEPTVLADGSISVTYEILVENAGPFPLTNVQVHDQLSQAFGVGSSVTTSRVRIEDDSPCQGFASSSYDGGVIDPVLVSGVELSSGEQCRLQYDAVVLPSKALPGPFRSSAFAIAADPFSGIVIDDSTDGSNPDPDGNQEPGDNDLATAVRVVVPEPELELAATLMQVDQTESDGDVVVSLEITVANVGAIDVDTTRLRAAFDGDAGRFFEVIDLRSDDLVVDDRFDGVEQLGILRPRNTIRSGEVATVVVEMRAIHGGLSSLDVDLSVSAVSATGLETSAGPADLVSIDLPEMPEPSSGFFSRLTVEEQRLVALGAGAFVLFFLVFIRHLVRRISDARRRRAGDRRRQQVIDLRIRPVDLRDRPHPTVRPDDGRGDRDRHHAKRRRGRGPGPRVDH